MPRSHIADCCLYGFIDTAYLGGRNPGELARQLLAGGVDVIQVRAKVDGHPRRVEMAASVLAVAAPRHVPVIVNDDLAAAFEAGADGVHLGQEDLAAIPRDERAERLAGMRIVGISTHSLEQALDAERIGADYIGVGPVFATATKPSVRPVGLELVQEVAQRVKVPLFAIGGITLGNVEQVLAAGARRIAVVSAILNADNVEQAAAQFRAKLQTTA